MSPRTLTHLQALEAESIHILREVAAEFQRPVMLYSIGKDSSVMVRLAQKAFYPAPLPFPLLHIDTSYKFREMVEFRDRFCAEIGVRLIVHTNTQALADGANPFRLGTQKCCGLLKTRALLDALTAGGFDAAFGGARRDEEKSRAKERIYRSEEHKSELQSLRHLVCRLLLENKKKNPHRGARFECGRLSGPLLGRGPLA